MIPMLPRLKTGQERQAKAIAKPGWVYGQFSDLRELAESLDVAAEISGRAGIDAIPDMWARSLVFAFALREPSHPLHARATGAFRGFLALLALRERRNLDVRVAL